MKQKGKELFENVIYCDSKLDEFDMNMNMYKNIDTVCYGFSKMIIDKLSIYKN